MMKPPDHSSLPAIFPPIAVPVGQVLGIGPEAMEYNQHFAGKTWCEVKRKHYERHTDAFSLMDRPSLARYIAGFIDLAIQEPNCSSAEYLVYFAGNREFIEFCGQLNPGQIQYILQTCEWLANDQYFSDDDRTRIQTNKTALIERGIVV